MTALLNVNLDSDALFLLPSTMSLPVASIEINYENEKGASNYTHRLMRSLTSLCPDKIQDFLSKFKFEDKDLANNFANIALDGDTPPLKYMTQLVRVFSLSEATYICADFFSATHRRPRSTNACDRP